MTSRHGEALEHDTEGVAVTSTCISAMVDFFLFRLTTLWHPNIGALGSTMTWGVRGAMRLAYIVVRG